MVHKSSIVPGLSKFIDENILAHYAPTSMKRILMAGAVSLYLKKNEGIVDMITSNPLFIATGVVQNDGMIDLDTLRDTLRREVNKAGFMRLNVPIVGDIDFTPDDIDALHKFITEANTQTTSTIVPTQSSLQSNLSGVY